MLAGPAVIDMDDVERIWDLAAWLLREGFLDNEPDALLTAIQIILVIEERSLRDRAADIDG